MATTEAARGAAHRVMAAGTMSDDLVESLVPTPDIAARVHALPPTQQRRVLAARVEWLRRKAPESVVAHAQVVHRDDHNRPIIPAAHHLEWVKLMEAREAYPWLCVVAPPGYAKSSWFSWVYATWRIGATGGRPRVGLVSNAAGQASAWTAAVGEAIDSDQFRACYPDVKPDKKRGWGKGKLFVTGAPEGSNPTLLASGIGGVSVLGKRFDEIILDDPTTWENARSQSVMDGQRHFLQTTLISRFPPGMGPPDGIGGRMVVVCTRWSERDLVPTLKGLGFRIVRMPALGYWDGTPDLPSDHPNWQPGEAALWPERHPAEQLHSLREKDPLVFELVMQGNPKVLEGDMFDPAWFKHGKPPRRDRFERVVQFVDTSSGRDKQRGDYFVAITLGRRKIEGEEEWWVLDIERDRVSTLRQKDRVLSEAAEWSPDKVIIEDTNEGRALYDALVGTNLPVDRYTPTKDKEFRAMPVASKYRAGRVWHPDPMSVAPDGRTYAARIRSLEAELEAFPNGDYDDQVDSLSGAFNRMTRSGARIRVLG